MTDVFMKGGDLETDTPTGRTPCEDEGRDQVMQQELRKANRDQQITRSQKKGLGQSLIHSSQEESTLQHLDLGLLASRTMRQYVSVG